MRGAYKTPRIPRQQSTHSKFYRHHVNQNKKKCAVGYGGLPNCNGLMEMDGAIMDGGAPYPSHTPNRLGAVCALPCQISAVSVVYPPQPHTHIHTCARVHTHTCAHMHTYTHAHMHTYTHAHMHSTCTHTHRCTCAHTLLN